MGAIKGRPVVESEKKSNLMVVVVYFGISLFWLLALVLIIIFLSLES